MTCVGTTPLLLHAPTTVDPLHELTKQLSAISSKTKKTDQDHLDMSHIEFMAGIYHLPDVGPYVPSPNLQKCLTEAARLNRKGKAIERGLFIETIAIPLVYEGPRDPQAMFEDGRFTHRAPVRVGQSRVMRTRPVLHEWSFTAHGFTDPSLLDMRTLQDSAEVAGRMIGLCDYRPTYGRFTATVELVK